MKPRGVSAFYNIYQVLLMTEGLGLQEPLSEFRKGNIIEGLLYEGGTA